MYNNMHSIYYYISACVRNALNAIEQLVHSTPAPVNTLFEKVFIRGFLCIKVLLTHTCTRHGWLFHMWVLHVIFLTFFVGPPPLHMVTFHLILSRVFFPPHALHVFSFCYISFTWRHVCLHECTCAISQYHVSKCAHIFEAILYYTRSKLYEKPLMILNWLVLSPNRMRITFFFLSTMSYKKNKIKMSSD